MEDVVDQNDDLVVDVEADLRGAHFEMARAARGVQIVPVEGDIEGAA